MANTPAFDLDAFGNTPMNCMTLIAGKAASATGHVLVGHNEDDGGHVVVRHGWVPPRDWEKGAIMPAEEGCALLPQVAHTLGYYWVEYRKDVMGLSNADGFVNERGVVIVSNSMGTSREGMENADCVKDGGIAFNLRRALAERAQTARDGARILMELIDEWGYAPSGRAYTIADRDEAFMFQLARGHHYMGARVPDDAIAVMPNHFNLHGLTDYPEQFYPADVVTYAIARGWYTPAKNGDFSDFDFARAYQAEDEFFGPRNVMRQKNGLRIALDRPWSVEKEGMPFCVRANRPVTAQMMADILSSHYEGTRDCCAHFGPGLSPHDASSIRYICTGTTLESDLFILRDEPELTTVMSSFGRPCQLPYIALHPLLAQPKALDPMADAGARMDAHLCPEDGASCWRDTPWWRMRAFETQAELLFSDVSGGLRALMERYKDDKQAQAFLTWHLLDGFRGTVFRQTMFAEFELAVNQMTERGEGLTADALCEKYRQLNADYFGPDIVVDDEISLEWARIPHFYYNYYVYQYSTGYAAAIAADETLFSCRQAAAALFDAEAEQVVFTMNATHGLNIAISSLLGPGRRAVISGFEHNAVTRPLAALGAEVTPVGGALFQPSDFLTRLEAALRQPCDAVICTHVSNVFGYRLPVEEVAALCRARQVPLVIDAAQSAGCLPISLQKTGAAFIAMPGHKRLCRSRRAWGRVLKSNCILCQKLQFQRKRCIPAGSGVADLG